MNLHLTDKVAIVTGGVGGIGRAIVNNLVDEGCKIAVCDIQGDKLEALTQAFQGQEERFLFRQVDVGSRQQVDEFVQAVQEKFGGVDLLFNVAGPGDASGQLDTTEENLDRQITGHLKGVFFFTQAVLKHMTEKRAGKIVNIGSFTAYGAIDGIPAYCAAFGGIIAYTKNVGRWAAHYNVNINSVSPGNIHTPMTNAWLSEGDNLKLMNQAIPIGRVGAPEDIADVCVFLASERARHVVATDINVSGGQLIM